jgi:hypothetical protein
MNRWHKKKAGWWGDHRVKAAKASPRRRGGRRGGCGDEERARARRHRSPPFRSLGMAFRTERRGASRFLGSRFSGGVDAKLEFLLPGWIMATELPGGESTS